MMVVWSRRIVGWWITHAGSIQIAADLVTAACQDGK
jgi:hypothetical protein